MPSTDIVDIGGIDVRSASVFYRDCAMPIVDWNRYCPPDEVLARMPVRVGAWENGTVAPAITDYTDRVDTTLAAADDCEVPTLNTTVDTCELVLPDMAEIGIKTNQLNWMELRTQFCRQRNILPRQLCIFNSDGSLAEGQPYMVDFIRFAMKRMANYLGEQWGRAVMIGDAANINEFDGLYNQLENGWAQSMAAGVTPCGDEYNRAQVIDWGALTGVGAPASPDAVTIAGQQITLWGTAYDVPEGLNLAQLIEDMLIDAVDINWADARGGVDMWEMHIPFGLKRCLLNTAACMQPCKTCGSDPAANGINFEDPGLRQRFIDMMNGDMMELMPSMTAIALLQSRYVAPNTAWLGPSSVGGRPSYVAFLDDIDRYFDSFGTDLANSGFGMLMDGAEEFLAPMTRDQLMNNFESSTLYWYIKQETIKCLEASAIMVGGVIACNRHLWIRFDNIDCCSAIEPCDSHLEVDGVAVQP